MKYYTLGFILASVLLGATSSQAQIDNLSSNSVLVCRSHQCAEASYTMTKGFLFNKIAQMMEKNAGKDILVCEADPHTHICLSEGITIPAQSSMSPVNMTIKNLKLVDDKKLNGSTGLDLVLD